MTDSFFISKKNTSNEFIMITLDIETNNLTKKYKQFQINVIELEKKIDLEKVKKNDKIEFYSKLKLFFRNDKQTLTAPSIKKQLSQSSQTERKLSIYDEIKNAIQERNIEEINKIIETANIDILENNLITSLLHYRKYINKKGIIGDKTKEGIIKDINMIVDGIYNTYIKIIEMSEYKDYQKRKIVIIVPGESGFRTMKVVELLFIINNKDFEIIYFPISNLSKSFYNMNDRLKNYFNNVLGLDSQDKIQKRKNCVFLLFDIYDTGTSLEIIKDHILSKYEQGKINRPLIKFFDYPAYLNYIPDIDFVINAEGTYRCQDKYTIPIDEDEHIKIESYNNKICFTTIFILYYKTLQKYFLKKLRI